MTPCGPFWALLEGTRVVSAGFGASPVELAEDEAGAKVSRAVQAWSDGDGSLLEDLPVRLAGTPIQQDILQAARAIRSGTTLTYGDLARTLGRPRAARAVGQALGRNSCLLLVPCHRVVARDGLGGYAGGQSLKARLLAHEAAFSRGAP
jgi:O-6-methylguanine DNA methyltransferase